MKNKIIIVFIISFLISTILFPVVNSQYRNKNIVTVEEFEKDENEIAVIQIGGDRQGNGGKKIEIPLSEAYRIKERLLALADKADLGFVDEENFAKELLTILIEENILPAEYTYENMIKLIDALSNRFRKTGLLDFSHKPLFRLIDSSSKVFKTRDTVDIDSPLHIGGLSFIGGFTIGGPNGFPIVIPPYFAEEIFNTTIFETLNLSAHWGYVTAGITLPGVPGYFVAMSSIPIPGLENYMTNFFTGQSIFGTYFLGTYISITCIMPTNYLMVFDITFGIYGLDIFIGLG